MKIRVTFEIDDTDRIAIAVASGNGFKNATREQLEEFITETVKMRMLGLRARFALATEQIAGEVATTEVTS